MPESQVRDDGYGMGGGIETAEKGSDEIQTRPVHENDPLILRIACEQPRGDAACASVEIAIGQALAVAVRPEVRNRDPCGLARRKSLQNFYNRRSGRRKIDCRVHPCPKRMSASDRIRILAQPMTDGPYLINGERSAISKIGK